MIEVIVLCALESYWSGVVAKCVGVGEGGGCGWLWVFGGCVAELAHLSMCETCPCIRTALHATN